MRTETPIARVWLLDDEEPERSWFQRALPPLGFDVRTFAHGDDLLAAAQDGDVAPPDVMVLDVVLKEDRPDGAVKDQIRNGLEVGALLRRSWPHFPFIVVTAYPDRIALQYAELAGELKAQRFVERPTTLTFDVVRAVRHAALERLLDAGAGGSADASPWVLGALGGDPQGSVTLGSFVERIGLGPIRRILAADTAVLLRDRQPQVVRASDNGRRGEDEPATERLLEAFERLGAAASADGEPGRPLTLGSAIDPLRGAVRLPAGLLDDTAAAIAVPARLSDERAVLLLGWRERERDDGAWWANVPRGRPGLAKEDRAILERQRRWLARDLGSRLEDALRRLEDAAGLLRSLESRRELWKQRTRHTLAFAQQVADHMATTADLLAGSPTAESIADARALASDLTARARDEAARWQADPPPVPEEPARSIWLAKDVLDAVHREHARYFRAFGHDLDWTPPDPDVQTFGWPDLLRLAVVHVLGAVIAGLRRTSDTGPPARPVRLTLRPKGPAGRVAILVDDPGPAELDPRFREQVFDPDTMDVDALGEATGAQLDLAHAAWIVRDLHLGRVRLEAPPEGWSNRYVLELHAAPVGWDAP